MTVHVVRKMHKNTKLSLNVNQQSTPQVCMHIILCTIIVVHVLIGHCGQYLLNTQHISHSIKAIKGYQLA